MVVLGAGEQRLLRRPARLRRRVRAAGREAPQHFREPEARGRERRIPQRPRTMRRLAAQLPPAAAGVVAAVVGAQACSG